MKKYPLLLLVVLSFTGCKLARKDVVKPKNPASDIIGTYRMTSFRYLTKGDEFNIPTLPVVQGKTTYSGVVKLTQASDPNQVNMIVRLDFEGQTESADFANLSVKESSSIYTLLSDGEPVATVSGSTLNFDVRSTEVRLAFTAKR